MATPRTAPGLAALPRLAHGFFTRRGGVSVGIYASLNCGQGSKDDREAVRANRARVAAALAANDVLTVHQTHSAHAVVAARAWDSQERPRADAVVTATRGLAVGVLTADCAPVLLADAGAGIVGAAHAGWRGTIAGILEAAVAAMEGLGARRGHTLAAVGPAIGQDAYEVGWDFEDALRARDSQSTPFFTTASPGIRPHFDLAGYVRARLLRAGLASVEAVGGCTFTEPETFFSFRRAQALKEPDYGRQISAIVLT